jgi:hypothetical protein
LYDYLILGQHFFTYPIFFKDKNIDFDVLFNKINQATDSLYDYQNHLDKQALLDLLKQYKEALATKSYTMVAHPDY